MSNIYPSILEKLAALNIDSYHYEDIVRCYVLAKLNIEHSGKSDYTDGIHTAEFAKEASRYQLLSPNVNPYYDNPAFSSLCSELTSAGMDKDCRLFFESFAPFLVADWDRLVSIFPKGHHDKLAYVQDFRRLIYYVVETAARHGECDNGLWESNLNPEATTESEEVKANQALLSKSLTIPQEQAVAKALLSDPLRSGQNMGLLLMYSLGLRNAEACAVNFGDIKPMQTHPECLVVWIYKTTGYDTNAGKLGGKTRNADRIIPMPDKVAALIHERRQYIKSCLNKSIEDYPIVCNNDRWDVRCSARELTNAARVLFQSIKIKAAQMASISEDLQDEPVSQKDSLPFEDRKDPTAYLFRRNFGTHLHILGLSEPEIEYVIGHDIDDPYETRNEFVNEIRHKLGVNNIVLH